MELKKWRYRAIAVALCFLLSPLAGFGQAGAPQSAGTIGALDPTATRNSNSINLRDEVMWNDLLATSPSGRLRVNLRDGSMLSLGSNSQMRVVQHDAAAQQTTLELLFGRLRSQVVKLTQPNSKFEVRTPTSVAGVIGTDFLLIVTPDRTTLVVYSGVVQMTPLNGAGGAPNTSQSVNVNPGQQVEVTASGVGPVQSISQAAIRQLISQTSVSHAGLANAAGIGVQTTTSIVRTVAIAVGSIAAGTVAGVTIANQNHTTTPTQQPSGPGIPPR